MQERSKKNDIKLKIIITYYEHMHIFIIIINTFHGKVSQNRVCIVFNHKNI